jgi:hypothetical protein
MSCISPLVCARYVNFSILKHMFHFLNKNNGLSACVLVTDVSLSLIHFNLNFCSLWHQYVKFVGQRNLKLQKPSTQLGLVNSVLLRTMFSLRNVRHVINGDTHMDHHLYPHLVQAMIDIQVKALIPR